ncbi:MAG: ABC transporter permease [Bacillota bacterium]
MKSFRTLLWSEWKLSMRDMNIPLFGFIQPLIVTVIIGFLGNQPAFEGSDYTFLQQSFGALASLAVCATGLMGLPLVVSDYRQKKILRQFMVTPVSPAQMLIVQCVLSLIASLISVVSIHILCSLVWGYRMVGNLGVFFLMYMLVVFAMYSIGMMIASVTPNMKSASLWCVVLYFPMFFFSGATIPYEIMPAFAQKLMSILPLTHGIKLLKAASLGLPFDHLLVSVLILSGIGILCTGLSIRFFKWT